MIKGMICSYLKGRTCRLSQDLRSAPARVSPTFISVIIFFFLFNLFSVHADFIFPARIEIKEISSGEFDVLFILPIINNKKLKAELVLPPICSDITEHQVKVTYTSYIDTWRFACKPEQLYGETIQIKGLLGTYVEIMLMIEMLDGRKYTTTLKPSKANFLIPHPPSIISLIGQSSYNGTRQTLMRPELYLLLFLLVFFITQRRSLILGLVAYFVSHLIAQYLVQNQLLKLSPYLPSFLILIVVLFPAIDLLRGKPALRRWFQPIWLLTIIVGFLMGGAYPDTFLLPGLSINEQYIVTIGVNLGIAVGLLLIFYLINEFRQLITMFVLRTRLQKAHIILGYMLGIPSFALILYQCTTLLIVTSILPEVSLEFFIFPILFGYWFWQTEELHSQTAIPLFLIIMGVGLLGGGIGFSIPLGSLLLYTSILIFSSQLLFNWKSPQNGNRIFAGIAILSFGWTASQFIFENLTLPIANTIGFACLAVYLCFIGYTFLTEKPTTSNSNFVRILAGVTGLIIISLRFEEYILLFNREIATRLAMGQLVIPLLSLIFVIGTIIVWPRKRKIHQHLGLETKKPLRHWAIICLSFLVLPFGHITVHNPLFLSHAPQGNEAKLILQQVLSNTYHAFNLENEDELYQSLATSVTGDLVANIYLDSRRRLTAGVRQGSEVAVRDVSVVSVGDLIEGINPADGYSYESKWTVTARVKHLQHIHHRKNIYSGVLKIKIEDNLWKISHIELQSEDRVIVSGSTG